MDAPTAFATVEDYEARYGEPVDARRCEALLRDASDQMLSAYEEFFGAAYAEGDCPTFDRSAEHVCCLLVNRVLKSPAALSGATQYSQGAGGYTASVTYGSALGEIFLGKTERRALGIYGQRMGSLRPMERGRE